MGLEYKKIDGGNPPEYRVIWFHGLGASSDDFYSVPSMFKDDFSNTEFIFPDAPNIPITVNGGLVMPGWYDIKEWSLDRKVDRLGLEKSCALVLDLMKSLDASVPPEKTILVGFSQGGALALYLGLNNLIQFKGILALSCYHPFPAEIPGKPKASPAMMLMHGINDPVVPLVLGERTCDALIEKKYDPGWKIYPMQHEVCVQQIQDIAGWLSELTSGNS